MKAATESNESVYSSLAQESGDLQPAFLKEQSNSACMQEDDFAGIPEGQVAITEIFSSLQGEGPMMGQKHIFVRFPACDIHCSFCDELDKPFQLMSYKAIATEILRLEKEKGPHSFLSFTGGEPLLYTTAMRALADWARGLDLGIYLETAGVHHAQMREIKKSIDYVSMDLKLPSVTHDKEYFKEHELFLDEVMDLPLYAKVVASIDTCPDEFQRAVSILAAKRPDVPLVIQPLTIPGQALESFQLSEKLETLRDRALADLQDVRIMPRLHKILRIL